MQRLEIPEILVNKIALKNSKFFCIELFDFGRKTKQIFRILSENIYDGKLEYYILKKFKRYLKNGSREFEVRGSKSKVIKKYSPNLIEIIKKLDNTNFGDMISDQDCFFFIEEFCGEKKYRLFEILNNNEFLDIDKEKYLKKAIDIYMTVANELINSFGYLLLSPNPKNIIFNNFDLNNGKIIDWTALGSSKNKKNNFETYKKETYKKETYKKNVIEGLKTNFNPQKF